MPASRSANQLIDECLFVLKMGTKIKQIRIVDGDHDYRLAKPTLDR